MIISAGKSTEKSGLRLERGPGFPHWTAGFFLGGLTEIVCDGRTWELPGRHAVIVAPHTPYELTLKKRQHEVWMIFDPRPRLLEALQPVRGQSASFMVSFQDPGIWAAVRAGLRDLLEWWGARVPQLPLAENATERVLLLARLAAKTQGAAPGWYAGGPLALKSAKSFSGTAPEIQRVSMAGSGCLKVSYLNISTSPRDFSRFAFSWPKVPASRLDLSGCYWYWINDNASKEGIIEAAK